MKRTPLFIAALLLLASPAAADVTGRYDDGKDAKLLVEVNDQGVARVGPDTGESYTIFTAEEGFIVTREAGQYKVIRWSDMTAAMDERMAALVGSSAAAPAAKDAKGPFGFERRGEVTVEGRAGLRYIAKGEGATGGGIVISSDPRLEPLGKAWSRFFRLNPSFGYMIAGKADDTSAQISKLLETGGALQIGNLKLRTAHFDDVPESRFKLPADPLTPDQVRSMLKRGQD